MQFCWVPAHAGIKGNEKADMVAKRALKLSNGEIMKVPSGKCLYFGQGRQMV